LAFTGFRGKRFLDSKAFVRAFAAGVDFSRGIVTALIVAAQPSNLLDLGCGSGSLLVELAKVDPAFQGIGIDSQRQMCALARRHIRNNSLDSRIRVLHLDARQVDRLPNAAALHASSLMNELFQDGPSEAVNYLKKLKRRFRNRDLWVVDYYGRLGINARDSGEQLHGLLHDLIQVLSGQGIPPSNLKSWRSIYRSADCQLREVHEFSDAGIDWFVHRLRL
jgi:SAM-dependent methyltransferase